MITRKEVNYIRYCTTYCVKNIIQMHGNFINYLENIDKKMHYMQGWEYNDILFNIMCEMGFENPIKDEEYYYEYSLNIVIEKEFNRLILNIKVKSLKLIESNKHNSEDIEKEKIREDLGKKYLEDIKKVREEYEKKIDDMRLQRDTYVKEAIDYKREKEEIIDEYKTLANDYNTLAYEYESLAYDYKKLETFMYDVCIRRKPFSYTYM